METADKTEIEALYWAMLDAWNRRNAADMAALYVEDGHVIGFDGSQHHGRAGIEGDVGKIFADHPTAAYVGKVREVHFPAPDVAILRAIVGMVPRGKSDLNPAANAFQSMIASRRDGQWRIELFQNTPAQFHGRPELAEQLTDELRTLL